MTSVRVSNAALADIDAILDGLVHKAGASTARRYAVDIDACVALLADFPGIGAPRPEFGPLTRISLVAPYLIFHDGGPEATEVVVLRVLDGSRKITADMIGRGRQG